MKEEKLNKVVIESTQEVSQEVRNIRLKFLSSAPESPIATKARTYGELIEEIKSNHPAINKKAGNWEQLVLVEFKTKVQYHRLSEAFLPTGNCDLLVTRKQEKFGAFITLEEFTSYNFGSKRRYLKENNGVDFLMNKANPTTDDLLQAFKKLTGNKTSKTPKEKIKVESNKTVTIEVENNEDMEKIHKSIDKRLSK